MSALHDAQQWVQQVVIGLNLCPYARRPWEDGSVRWVLCDSEDMASVLTTLWLELDRLVAAEVGELETTLMVLPHAARSFDAFLTQTDLADDVLQRAGYDGIVQIVTFHPEFRFASVPLDDPGNAVNRSPVAMWHLLRESSVERVLSSDPDAGRRVSEANRKLLRSLDARALSRLWREEE